MLSKIPPVLPPNRFKRALKNNVAALPMLVAEESVFFDKNALAMKKMKQRQKMIQRKIIDRAR